MAREINKIDYEKRLDDDLKDFIRKIENHSDSTAGEDIKKIRNSYSKVCSAFKSALPPDVKIETKILKSNKKKIDYRISNNKVLSIVFIFFVFYLSTSYLYNGIALLLLLISIYYYIFHFEDKLEKYEIFFISSYLIIFLYPFYQKRQF